MKTFVIIPAGGKGTRCTGSKPKQYTLCNRKEVIVYTIETFQKSELIDEIYIAAEPSYFLMLEKLKKKYRLSKVKSFVEGGNERQDSVYNVLKKLPAENDDLVIVHDAARPLLSKTVLHNAVNIAVEKGNSLVCIKAKDTLLKGNEFVSSYVNRDNTYYVQTPQIFTFGILMKAMKKAYKENFYGTDESMLVHRIGKKIFLSEGSLMNFKITTGDDLQLFRKIVTRK